MGLDFRRGLSFWSPLEVPLRGQIGDSIGFALHLRGWFFPQPRKDYCMATLESHYGRFRIVFRFSGQKFCRSLQTENERSARSALARLEDNLARLKMGQLILPPGADLVTFLLSDGRLEQRQTEEMVRRYPSRHQSDQTDNDTRRKSRR